MARTAGGLQNIEAARLQIKSAKTADELRAAQAVLLPLELGLTIDQTALAIGRSRGVACSLRTRFSKVIAGQKAPRNKHQLRNRARFDFDFEKQALDQALSDAAEGGVLVIPQVMARITELLGSAVPRSSLYRMLERHGWRKIAPDTQHPKGDESVREDWKKNSKSCWKKLSPNSKSPSGSA